MRLYFLAYRTFWCIQMWWRREKKQKACSSKLLHYQKAGSAIKMLEKQKRTMVQCLHKKTLKRERKETGWAELTIRCNGGLLGFSRVFGIPGDVTAVSVSAVELLSIAVPGQGLQLLEQMKMMMKVILLLTPIASSSRRPFTSEPGCFYSAVFFIRITLNKCIPASKICCTWTC